MIFKQNILFNWVKFAHLVVDFHPLKQVQNLKKVKARV